MRVGDAHVRHSTVENGVWTVLIYINVNDEEEKTGWLND